MRTYLRGKVTLLFMTCAVLLAIPAIALADNFQNTLAASETGTRTITTDGTTAGSTIVGYRVIGTGGDSGPTGPGGNCNATTSNPLGVSFSVANVTASPSSLSFTSCGSTSNVTFSSKTPGTYIIDPTLTFSATGGTYTDQSPFTLHVQGTGTSVTDVSGSGTEGESDGSLSARLVWNNNNVGGKTISFAIDKAKNGTFTTVGSATTDDTTGVATLSNVSLAGLAPGTYDLKATFAGDNNYAGDDTTGTLTVDSADDVAPTSTHSLSSAANGNGWHNQNVTVTLNATDNDGGSSVDEIRYSINGGANAVYDETNKPVISTEGTTTFSYFAVDNNNNVEDPANSFQIKLDKTAPSVAYQSASPAPNGAGWNNTNVTATFEATDTLSGMGATDADQTDTGTNIASTEGTNVTVGSPAFTDRAGNTAAAGTATSAGFNIDKTKPTVSVTGVSNGATYTIGAVPTPGCNTTDGLSDVKTNATVNVTGGTPLGVGNFTATCSGAVDNADNNQAAPVSVTYKVTTNWSGFSSPVDNLPTLNSAKAGQAIPLKWRITNSSGNPITNLTSVAVTTSSRDCSSGVSGTDALEEYAAGSSGLQNLGDGYYQFNWKSPTSYANSCKTINLDMGEGVLRQAAFQFKK
jgi:hypothetical protein